MKINHSLFIILALFALPSGCSKHGIAAAAYYSLHAISDSRNGVDSKTLDDPKYSGNALKIMNHWESYDSYQRKREKKLKEGQKTEGSRNLYIYRDLPPESTLENILGGTSFLNISNDHKNRDEFLN